MAYKGYQLRKDVHIGNFARFLSPKIARSMNISRYLVDFILSYRGGRNESMMYGYLTNLKQGLKFIDYDLVSCYTTVMSLVGDPNYKKVVRLMTMEDVHKYFGENLNNLLTSYSVFEVSFEFPSSIKYPCIPCRVDDNIEIYPMSGNSVITGCELFVAIKLNCKITLKDGVVIPFKRPMETNDEKLSAMYPNLPKEF